MSVEDGHRLVVSGDDEYDWVSLKGQPIVWRRVWTELMLNLTEHHPYIDGSFYERNGVNDQKIDFGDYLSFAGGPLHVESGFGITQNYLYKFQLSYDYQHRVAGNFFAKIGSRYLDYAAGQVGVNTVGVLYYFGDNYVEADYGLSLTEARGLAQWGSGRINAVLTPRWTAWAGFAAGQRLYDIFPLPARDQEGDILFAGMDFRVIENLKMRAGFTYAEEAPAFVSRGVDGGLALRF